MPCHSGERALTYIQTLLLLYRSRIVARVRLALCFLRRGMHTASHAAVVPPNPGIHRRHVRIHAVPVGANAE